MAQRFITHFYNLRTAQLQDDSLERGPEYSLVTPVMMKQPEGKYAAYLAVCNALHAMLFYARRILTRRFVFLNVSASIREDKCHEVRPAPTSSLRRSRSD